MLRLDTKHCNKRSAVEGSEKQHALAWLVLQKAASGPWLGYRYPVTKRPAGIWGCCIKDAYN